MKHLNLLLHLVFLSVIAVLAGFIIQKKTGDFDPWLPGTAASTFTTSTAEVQKTNRILLRIVEENTAEDPNESNLGYLKHAQKFRAMADSLRQLVDSLDNHYDATFMVQTRKKIVDFRDSVFSFFVEKKWPLDSLVAFDQMDASFAESMRATHDFPPAYQALLLAQMKAEIAYHERNVLMLCLFRTATAGWGYFRFRKFIFSCNQLTPKVGDSIQADVFMGQSLPRQSVYLKYFLNGKPLALSAEGKPIVEQVFDTPGTYPLTFTIQTTDPETDTIQRYDRTYFLHVDGER